MKTLPCLLLGASLITSAARAQPLTPEQKRATEKHFGQALKLTADRDYEGAIAAFGHAYALSREPEALLNQGLLHAKLDRPVEAIEALDQVLRAPGDLAPDKLAKVRQVRATQAATIGHLEVVTGTPARLEVDGLDVGRTPLPRPLALKAGRHLLVVVATGFAPLRRAVEVKAGRVERLSLELISMTGRLANLRVVSPLPGVAVTVDGHFVGHTPLASALAVPPGRHDVSFQRPGYVPLTRSVMLADGAAETLDVALALASDDPASAASRLQLAISEPGASVTLDGSVRRIPPAGLPLPLGAHQLAIEHEGFLPYQRQIALPTPGAHAFQITLEPTEMTRYQHRQKASRQRLRAWAVLGGGALVTAGGTFLLIRAFDEDRSAQRDFEAVADSLKVNGECYTGGPRAGQEIDQAACRMRIDRANDRVDNARSQSWIARGTFALGLGVLATGLVLRLLAEDPDKYEARDLQLLGSSSGVGLGREILKVSPIAGTAGGDDRVQIVAASSVMRALLEQLRLVARKDTTILLVGETGTGKEVLAREVHATSARAGRPFVAVNCAAVPETLIESEFFGHERGAFSGATRDKPGLFEAADGGTLFLDEVGELSLSAQARLLRALQERRVRRVGDSRGIERPVDVRLVSATNRDLDALVAKKLFREDLLYRLKVVTFRLPPLRERPEDLKVLAGNLLRELSMDRTVHLTAEALELLCRHSWPGNVRELRNFIEALLAQSTGDVIDAATVAARLPASSHLAETASSQPTGSTGERARFGLAWWRFGLREELGGACYLRAVDGLDAADEISPLPAGGRVRLGREGAADLVLATNEISRQHATFVVDGDRVTLCDDGSRNGTFLDGARLAPGAGRPLAPGAILRLGKEWVGLFLDAQQDGAPLSARTRALSALCTTHQATRIELKTFERLLRDPADADSGALGCEGGLLRFEDDAGAAEPDAARVPAAALTAEAITRACELCGGNKRATARMLGISQTTLYERIKQFGLQDIGWTSTRKV